MELFLPFEVDGKKVEAITFSPIRFDHTLRWQQREWKTMLSLMAEMAKVEEKVLRGLAYPDADRVMAVFIDMLPPEIRSAVVETGSEWPSEAAQPPAVTNGGQDPSAPKYQMDLPDQQQLSDAERDTLGLGVDMGG